MAGREIIWFHHQKDLQPVNHANYNGDIIIPTTPQEIKCFNSAQLFAFIKYDACVFSSLKGKHLLLYCTPLAKRLCRLWFIDCRPAGMFLSLSCPPSEPTSFFSAENILTMLFVQFPFQKSEFKCLLLSVLD